MTRTVFRMSLLGTPEITRMSDGERLDVPLGKPLAALTFVALARGRVTRDDLMNLLWPTSSPRRARASVRQALWLLRKQIHPDVVVETEGTLQVDNEVLSHDLDELGEAIADGRLNDAWEAWQGGPLRGLAIPDAPAWEAWADDLRSRWERRLGEALETEAASAEGTARLGWLKRAIEVRPFREAVHVLLVRSFIELRREDDAEDALHRFRSVVDEPDPETLKSLEQGLRHLRRRGVERPEDDLVPEFVGRSRELAELTRLWRSATSGRARMVTVTGPAGIGKSRLAAEILRRATLDSANVAEAAALDVERTLELGVAATLVRALLGLPGAAGISAGSTDALQTLLPSTDTASRRDRPPASATALADAMVDLLEAVAHEAPVLLVVEDAHWADAASQTLLLRALRSLRGVRVLMLWTCRTDEGDSSTLRTIRSLEASQRATVLELAPLSMAETREMLTLLVERAPAEGIERLARALHDTSGGNPLHIVELLRGLRDDGVLVREAENGWVLAEDRIPAALELPLSFRQALERRLSLLSPAALVLARTLAGLDRPQTPRALMSMSQLSAADESNALHELLRRNVLRWTRNDRLDFAHASIREAVRPKAPESPSRRRWLALAAMIAAFLVIGVLARHSGASAEPVPFGGGTLWIRSGTGTYHGYRVGQGDPSALLETESVELPVGLVATGTPVLGPDGSWWFGGQTSLDPVAAPDAWVYHRGQTRTILSTPGDDGVKALEPNLRAALLNVQAADTMPYRKTVVRLDLESGESETLADGENSMTARRWSADGSLIVGDIDAAWDTVFVLRPDGHRIASLPAPDPEVRILTFCGTGAVAGTSVARGALVRGFYWNLDDGEVRPIRFARPFAHGIACSPDGSAIAYVARIQGREEVVVQAFDGPVVASLDPGRTISDVVWSVDPTPAPARVSVDQADTTLSRGQRSRLSAVVADAHGRPMDVPVVWSSDNPAVASVASDGRIWANRAGAVTLRAAVYGWIQDSVRIQVTESASRGLILSDSFPTMDSDRWATLGYPSPVPATDEVGRPVLDMRGDGRSNDGIISRSEVPLPRGGALEVRFRLPVTERVDRQSIQLCLVQARRGKPEEILKAWAVTARVCAKWPARQLADFDPGLVQLLGVGTAMGPVDAGRYIDASGWNRMVLQMRADGLVSLFINDSFVVSHPVRANNAPGSRWRVLILDSAADTHAFLRDVTLWDEARYPVPDTVASSPPRELMRDG